MRNNRQKQDPVLRAIFKGETPYNAALPTPEFCAVRGIGHRRGKEKVLVYRPATQANRLRTPHRDAQKKKKKPAVREMAMQR